MKKYISEFVQRGLMAAAGGPVVLAVIYGILGASGVIDTLTPAEVCKGVLSITVLGFIAGGITMIYAVERLPLISAILIHAGVLYLDYLLIYLVNDWLARDWMALGIFTAAFATGYAVIWVCIYLISKKNADQVNRKLRASEQNGTSV